MHPTILALDTATDICSVALAINGAVVARTEHAGQKHSELLLPMVTRLLDEQGIDVHRCDAVAFGAGPGSFTGLRIACGVAQGLAYAAGKLVVPVGNLHALAWGLRQKGSRILAAVDARMNEAYCAVFDVLGDTLATRLAPSLIPSAAMRELIRAHQPTVAAGNAFARLAIDTSGLDFVVFDAEARAEAAAFAELGVRMYGAGLGVGPADAAPIYVRDRVALTIEERRARSAEVA